MSRRAFHLVALKAAQKACSHFDLRRVQACWLFRQTEHTPHSAGVLCPSLCRAASTAIMVSKQDFAVRGVDSVQRGRVRGEAKGAQATRSPARSPLFSPAFALSRCLRSHGQPGVDERDEGGLRQRHHRPGGRSRQGGSEHAHGSRARPVGARRADGDRRQPPAGGQARGRAHVLQERLQGQEAWACCWARDKPILYVAQKHLKVPLTAEWWGNKLLFVDIVRCARASMSASDDLDRR